MKMENYLKPKVKKEAVLQLPAQVFKMELPEEPDVRKVEIINPESIKVDKDIQKVEIVNQQEIPKPPEVQKVLLINPNKDRDIQPVKVTNQKDIVFPKVQKVELTNEKDVVIPDIFTIKDLPIGEENIPGKADPFRYLVVRITDGKNFVRPTDKIAAGGGGGVASTIGNNVIAGQITVSGSTLPVGTGKIMNGIIIEALSTNTGSVYVGPVGVTSGTGFELQPGQSTSLAINDLSKVYVAGTGTVCFITTN